MSIELANEKTISLMAAARLLPPGRRGRPVCLSTILRWILNGALLPSGERLRLEAVRCGGRWITSVEALERWCAKQTPDLDKPYQVSRTIGARARANERAKKELAKAGF